MRMAPVIKLVQQGLEQFFQHGALLPVQGDLAVEGVEDGDDFVLLVLRLRIRYEQVAHDFEVEVLLLTAVSKRANRVVAPSEEVVQVAARPGAPPAGAPGMTSGQGPQRRGRGSVGGP